MHGGSAQDRAKAALLSSGGIFGVALAVWTINTSQFSEASGALYQSSVQGGADEVATAALGTVSSLLLTLLAAGVLSALVSYFIIKRPSDTTEADDGND